MSTEAMSIPRYSPSRIGCIIGGALIAIAGVMNIVFQGDFGRLPGLTSLGLSRTFGSSLALAYFAISGAIVIQCLWIALGVLILLRGLMNYRTLTLVTIIAWVVVLVVPSIEYLIWEIVHQSVGITFWRVTDSLIRICVLVALCALFAIKPGARNVLALRRSAIVFLAIAVAAVLWQAGLRVEHSVLEIPDGPSFLPLAYRITEDIKWFVGIMPFVCGWIVVVATMRIHSSAEQIHQNG